MNVKKVKTESGYFRYEVESCKHVRIAAPYTVEATSCWSVRIPDITSSQVRMVSVYTSPTLSDIRRMLESFKTEEELFGTYYKARLNGRSRL